MPAAPSVGPIDLTRAGKTAIYLDPSLSERVTASRTGDWLGQPDSVAARKQRLLRRIGYAIINRRFQREARSASAAFRGAGFGTGDVFEEGRTTNLIVDAGDGEWDAAFRKAVQIWNRAITGGFSQSEVDEQIVTIRTQIDNAVAGAQTRSHGQFTSAILRLLDDGIVPSTPISSRERFEAAVPDITAEAVLAAVKADAAPLENPLIRFRGRKSPDGGEAALRKAWEEAIALPVSGIEEAEPQEFGYTSFGEPGSVISDVTDERLGIRMLTFANGLRLNLKATDLSKDRVRYRLRVDGGAMLDTPDDPLATALTSSLPVGGLGKHTQDELQSILAGKSVGWSIGAGEETFILGGGTTRRDLGLQMYLLTAALTDPGYRKQGEVQYRRNIANFFANLNATPGSTMRNALGGILSDNDPRFSLQTLEQYRALDFAKLKSVIGERLDNGALELALVGDFDPEEAITLTAKTLGALPAREPAFRPYEDRRDRSFTANRSQRILRHAGEADQALLYLTWPTRDDADLTELLQLEVLERIVRLELTDTLRESLGKAYSPGASNRSSGTFDNYGTFAISASVDVADVDETRAAVRKTIERLTSQPISADTLDRARRPVIENYDNALKSNSGWLALTDRAQSEPEKRERFLQQRDLLLAITAEDIQRIAERYLMFDEALEVLTLPEGEATD